MLGQGRLEAQCMDGVKRLCHIRGKMRKKVWVNVGDIVLLGLREYQVLPLPCVRSRHDLPNAVKWLNTCQKWGSVIE